MKKIAAFLLACTMMAPLAACGSNGKTNGNNTGNNSGGSDNSTVTLQYYHTSDEDKSEKRFVDDFNSTHSNIRIEEHSNPFDGYNDKVQALLSSNSEIDLFTASSYESNQYADKGVIADLTELIESSDLELSNYGNTLEAIKQDGKHFALPTWAASYYLFYNKDLFDAEGVAYPGQMTWDEYAELAASLTKGSGTDKQWGGLWVTWLPNFMALQAGEYLTDDALPQTERTLKFYNQLYNVDQSHIGTAEMSDASYNCFSEFENGKIAMLPQGSWAIHLLETDREEGKFDFEWEIAPMPVFDDVETGSTVCAINTININAKSKDVEKAFEFAKFVSGEDGSVIRSECGQISCYITDTVKQTFIDTLGKESAAALFESKLISEVNNNLKYNALNKAFSENAELYFLDELTLEQTMDNFLSERADILAD